MDWQRIERELNLQAQSLSGSQSNHNSSHFSLGSLNDNMNLSATFPVRSSGIFDPRASITSNNVGDYDVGPTSRLKIPRAAQIHEDIDFHVSRKQLHSLIQDIQDLSIYSRDSSRRIG